VPAERISKVLAAAGVASRRAADELVAGGRVMVDGRPAVVGEKVDPATQRIDVDGRQVTATREHRLYIAVHKPAGVASTVKDRHAERTVVDLVPRELARGTRLYPVGRLDQDSEGLILLTNDGDWAEHVLHPRYGVEREYAVGIARPLTREQAQWLETGVELTEGVATVSPLRGQTHTEDRRLADILEPPPDPRLTWVRVTIHQGWKRQLRRMFGTVEAPIRRLVRVRIGPVRLEGLATGDVRPLTPAEVRRLGAGLRAEPRGRSEPPVSSGRP
jgi:23S rRNA pseudouridine2605 synthase